MIDFNINDFSRYTKEDIESITEINPDAEIKLHRVDGIKYIRATNFLKRPDDLAEFMSKFPAEDKNLTVAAGQKSDVGSSAPGFQQYIREFYFRKLNSEIFKIGYDLKLHKYNRSRTEFDNFTNCCYPGMQAYHRNYLPHTDSFGLAAKPLSSPSNAVVVPAPMSTLPTKVWVTPIPTVIPDVVIPVRI